MKIARNKVLADSTESPLPTSWPTLHVLACIPEDKLKGKRAGSMRRADPA